MGRRDWHLDGVVERALERRLDRGGFLDMWLWDRLRRALWFALVLGSDLVAVLVARIALVLVAIVVRDV